MPRIAITGSSGLIGSAFRAHAESAGHEIVRVRRGAPSDPAASWDPQTGWFREGALEGVDAVVHLAGESIGDGRWSARRKQELVSSRIDGTRLLIDHLASLERKPAVLVCASAIGFYGDRGDEQLSEESSAGTGFLADLVVAWEREAARANELGIRTVFTRFGIVLSKEGGALKKMLLPFKMGVGGRLGAGKNWMSFVALPDVVGAIETAITSDLSGPVNVTAPNPVTNADYTKALGKAIHRPTLFPVPPFGLKLLFGAETAEELLLSSQRVNPAKLSAAGYRFHQPDIASALTAALR